MRSRGLVVALAVLLAVAAAGAVVLYTSGVKKAAESGGSLTTVIVATQNIPANTNLNDLIQSGGFKELAVPADGIISVGRIVPSRTGRLGCASVVTEPVEPLAR